MDENKIREYEFVINQLRNELSKRSRVMESLQDLIETLKTEKQFQEEYTLSLHQERDWLLKFFDHHGYSGADIEEFKTEMKQKEKESKNEL